MKAKLKEVKTWAPHKAKPGEETSIDINFMHVYVGSLFVGTIAPTTTEPEELFKFKPLDLLIHMDVDDSLSEEHYMREGRLLQDILDDIETVFTKFVNKICL